MPTATEFSTRRSEIAGVSVLELADRFGTPCYIYDLATILERVNDLQAFDTIRYAQKACSNIAILDRLRRAGVLVDAVSAGEIVFKGTLAGQVVADLAADQLGALRHEGVVRVTKAWYA